MVYLPCAPLPMSGGLVMVSEDAIIPVPEMKVDDLLRDLFLARRAGARQHAERSHARSLRQPRRQDPARAGTQASNVLSQDAAE